MPIVKYADTVLDAQSFSAHVMINIGVDIPWLYFYKSSCYVQVSKDGIIEGGFAIVHRDVPRSLAQIPNFKDYKLYKAMVGDMSELTGYFINNKKGAFWLTLRLLFEVMKDKNRWFIYSYKSDNTKLAEYYSKGNPVRIYSGLVDNLPGMEGANYENVELLTKFGVYKIFAHRTLSKLFRRRS